MPTPVTSRKTRRFLPAFLIVVIVLQLSYSWFLAAAKPMSADELMTLALGRLRSLPKIWQAELNGVDALPPLYHYVEGIALRLPVRPEIALRIPSMIGFSLLLVSLFLFLRERMGDLRASVAACLPLVTNAYWYSYEARNYALMVGMIALALVFWRKVYTEAPRLINAILFALILAASSAISYNTIYALIALFLVEIAISLRRRRLNWRVLIALLLALLPCLLYWPILKRYQEHYGSGFWAKPSLGLVVETVYSWANESTALFLLLLMTIGVFIVLSFRQDQPADPKLPELVLWEEWVLGMFFSTIPVIAFVVASVLKGGMVPRYSICVIIGAILLVTYATRSLNRLVVTVIIGCAVAAFTVAGAWRLRVWTDPASAAWKPHSVLRHYLNGNTPTVISNGLDYVQLAYYSSPQSRQQLYYIADSTKALQYLGTDTVDLSLPILARYLPLQVVKYEEFLASHHEFFIYAGSGWDWLAPDLAAHGHSLQLIEKSHEWALYRVKS